MSHVKLLLLFICKSCLTLCYSLSDSPGKNIGVGYHFLLQGIFLTQGLNPCLLYWQLESTTEPLGKPKLESTSLHLYVNFPPLRQ